MAGGSGTGTPSGAITNTTQELITRAYQTIGVTQEGGTPSTTQLTSGLLNYTTMIKNWTGYGIDTWARATSSITLVADQASYTIGPGGDVDVARPLRIVGENAYRTNDDGISTPLVEYSKQEYFYLSDKAASGIPTQYYYDQEDPVGNFFVWPVPSSTELPMTITFDYHVPIVESELTAVPNLPAYWEDAIIFNLARRLALPNGRQVSPELKELAVETLQLATGQEYEQANIYPQPDYRYDRKN